jgi:hypothetical protein
MEEIRSQATLPRPWPEGQYRVDIYVDGQLIKSEGFTIKKA